MKHTRDRLHQAMALAVFGMPIVRRMTRLGVCLHRSAARALLCFLAMVGARFLPGQNPMPTRIIASDLSIRGATTDLTYIASIDVSDRGIVAVAQPLDNRIAFFNSSGQPLGFFGRVGRGPGEFQRIQRIGWAGDTLWVWDPTLQRLTLVHPDRRMSTSVSLSTPRSITGLGSTIASYHVIGVAPNENILLEVRGSTRNAGSNKRTPAVISITRAGSLEAIVAGPLPPNGASYEKNGTGVAVPFGMPSVYGVARNGFVYIEVRQAGVGPGTGGLRLRAVSQRGQIRFDRTAQIALERIPQRVRDSAWAASLRRVDPYSRRVLEEAPRPIVYPPATRIVVSRDGRSAIRLHTTGPGAPWMLLDARGAHIATVVLPSSVVVHAYEGQHLWGTTAETTGFDSIVRFRVSTR